MTYHKCNNYRSVGASTVLLLSLLFVSCASIGTAKGPKFETISTIPEGYALVYLYFPRLKALGHEYRLEGSFGVVGLDSKSIIFELQKGGYFPILVRPETCELLVQGVGRSVGSTRKKVTIKNIQLGHTYYVRLKSGFSRSLEQVTAEIGSREITKLVWLQARSHGQLYNSPVLYTPEL